jgi:hypothetical protein
MIFPLLSGWLNSKPSKEYHESFGEKLKQVFKILDDAKVVHMDTRATNIMWKQDSDGTVAIKLIDFEDALVFGQTISRCLISKIIEGNDFRYPIVHDISENQVVGPMHNQFFLQANLEFLESDAGTYDEFMQEDYRGLKIFMAVKESSVVKAQESPR